MASQIHLSFSLEIQVDFNDEKSSGFQTDLAIWIEPDTLSLNGHWRMWEHTYHLLTSPSSFPCPWSFETPSTFTVFIGEPLFLYRVKQVLFALRKLGTSDKNWKSRPPYTRPGKDGDVGDTASLLLLLDCEMRHPRELDLPSCLERGKRKSGASQRRACLLEIIHIVPMPRQTTLLETVMGTTPWRHV